MDVIQLILGFPHAEVPVILGVGCKNSAELQVAGQPVQFRATI